ncbi:MAG TPA: N-acetylmuramoyl-L-alanine amidase, partial [Nocardioidaceae bacterium]|nr:N-acetylmuramoyl-L-alanine amidase [Nocardioidaceae bacterium]
PPPPPPTALLGGVPVAAQTAEPAEPASPQAVQATSIRLAAVADASSGVPHRVGTPRLPTASYSMVAVTWRGTAEPRVAVRTRSGRAWSDWRELHTLHEHAPESVTAEPAQRMQRSGTELLWVGPSDGVQVRMAGPPAQGARVTLVDPGTLPSDTRTPAAESAPSAVAGVGQAPQPKIRVRRAWGADDSWRSGDPVYMHRIKMAHIHHSAGTNNYTRSDVPAIIRGMYWYHTQQLGWSDIGYNFVVDKFGRIWVGRAGGYRRPVRGAHTLGFNHASVGVAALGNFDGTRPPRRLVGALVRLTAWKLDAYGRRPAGYSWMRSHGSDRYPEGTRVRLRTIDGHRDTNQTACPGDHLYGRLPEIRRRAQQRVDAF